MNCMAKVQKMFFIGLFAAIFFVTQAMAEEGPNLTAAVQFKEEHKVLKDQLKNLTNGKVKISDNAKTGKVRYIGVDPSNAIRQPTHLSAKPTPEEAARGFLSVYGPLFGLKDQNKELRVMRTKTADRGRSSVRFQQVHSGIPIFGGESIVHVNSSNNIISAHSKILPDIDIDTTPAISPEMAEKTAMDIFVKTYQSKYTFDISALQVSTPELWIYNPILLGFNEDITHLVWRMELTPKETLLINELVLVDSKFGNVILHFNQSPSALYREIYDHNNTVGKPLPGNPGDLRRYEGQGPSGITDVDKAYDYAGDTYDFYWNYHGRDSIDNAGMQLISTTRYCPDAINCPYENAFWYPTLNQMVYGEGFASADDLVAHEMTHGVTKYESGLIYLNQSGAINEAFSDIWGEFVDLTNGKGNDAPSVRWLFGEDLPGGASRSMSNPPADGSSADRMWNSYYYCGTCDQGGVHTNSGVGNKAAYLMTDGGTFNGFTVTGLGITKVAKIFYEVQNSPLITSTGDFDDLANALWQACVNLVGTDDIITLDCNQVANAINATEMNHQGPENLVQNPGFESGHVNWTEYSDGGYDLVTNDYFAACGDWYAWLGGYNFAVDYIYQDIIIPSNATQASLQFWYDIDTLEWETVAYDKIFVEVRRPSDNVLLKTLLTLSNVNATPYWKQSTRYDLLAYKGQTIRLRFYATNDYLYATDFFVDDVVLKVGAKNTPAVTSFKINGGAASTAKGTVTLNNVATSNPTHYMASEDSGFTGVSWQIYSTAPKFTLSSGIGTKTVYFKVKNAFDESAVMDDEIEALKPVVSSFKINAGALSTSNNAAVTLNNTATNLPTHYMASESSDFAGAIWQKYSTAPSFALSSGRGIKTIYFKVKNVFSESAFVSDTISALAPAVTSFKISAGALNTAKGTGTLNNAATNLPTHYMASESSDFDGAIWQKYSTAPSFALSSGRGTKTVYFKVRNTFDESSVVSDTISALAPIVTSFKISAGALNTAKGTVTLNNTATNSPTHYMASEASDFAGAIWQKYSTAPSFILSVGDGTKTVYFKVKNSFDESAAVNDTISAMVPAVTSFKINAGATSTANGKVTLNNVATNRPTHYMASESFIFEGAMWQTYSTAPKFTLSDGAGTKTVYFKVKNSFVESAVVSDTIIANGLPPVVTSFRINAGAASTLNGLVTLNNTGTNSPMYYMASEDPNFSTASWQPYTTAPKFTLSDGAGMKTVYFKTMNIFGESYVVSDTISALAPAVTSFKISAGALNTAKGTVTLNNAATNLPTHYMASESSDFGGGSWQTYSTAPKFTLSDGAGTKTVYFKVKNSFVESAAVSDTISALVPAVTSFKINAGALSTAKGLVTLNNTAMNSPTHYMTSESSDFAGGSWQTYSTAPKLTLSDGCGTRTVYFKVKNAFDESPVVSDTISALAPIVTSFRISAGAVSTANGLVTLNNAATNLPTHYMASESSDFAGGSWQTYSTAPKFAVSDGSGTKTVYFKVKNSFVESAVVSDTIIANGLPPVVISFKINAGAASAVNGLVTLNNTGTNSPMYYMASEDPNFSTASWQPYTTAPKFTLSDGAGTKTVYFKTMNIFGESYVVSDTIFLY